MINDINISIELLRGMPELRSPLVNLTIGTMWDNEAQCFVFNRADAFKDYDMTLMLRPSRDNWYEVGLGTGNTYTISNALTQKEQLTLQVVFYEGGKYRCSSINTLRFLYAPAPQNGAIPEELTDDYRQLLSTAVTNGAVVNGEYVFSSQAGTELFRLVGSAGKSAYEIAVEMGFVGSEAEWVESMKGESGEKGHPGADGKNGKDGADGYTPVRGVDYWTAEDISTVKSEVNSLVEDAITAAIGGAY